jgi:hypothetical protein
MEGDTQPMPEAPQGAADTGDGQSRRRRRRGGRGGERGERGERAPRENFAVEEASPADAIESRAAELERAREPEAPREFESPHERQPLYAPQPPEGESRQYDPRRDDVEHEGKHETVARAEQAPPVHEPKLAYSSAAPPRGFQVVSEHDAAEEGDAHRPQRRRRQGAATASEQQELQLVETQVEAAPISTEDELPQRTKPRRRRSGPVEAEPLMLVETQANAEAQRTDGTPAP